GGFQRVTVKGARKQNNAPKNKNLRHLSTIKEREGESERERKRERERECVCVFVCVGVSLCECVCVLCSVKWWCRSFRRRDKIRMILSHTCLSQSILLSPPSRCVCVCVFLSLHLCLCVCVCVCVCLSERERASR